MVLEELMLALKDYAANILESMLGQIASYA